MSDRAKLAFFFGSGISYNSYAKYGVDAGTVNNITRRLFEENWRYSSAAERFYPGDSRDDPLFFEDAKRCQEFLKLVKTEIDPHLLLRGEQHSHYENLYAAVYHLWNDEMEEIISPLVARSLKALQEFSAEICGRLRPEGSSTAFRDLMGLSLQLIQSVVLAELGQSAQPVQLDLITALARHVGRLDIFSLNHDSLVESQFENTGVKYTDGFEDRQDGYRIYSPNWDQAVVRVLKLQWLGGQRYQYSH